MPLPTHFAGTVSLWCEPPVDMKILRYLATPGHPNILTLHAAFQDEDNYYQITPFFRGEAARGTSSELLRP